MENKAEWLKSRKRGIGGSEVAPILGLSPWKTAYQVWEDKTGLSTGVSEETPAMAYGKLMEPVLRQWYSNHTGREVGVPAQVLIHPKHDIVLASVDGLTDDDRVLEIKTARSMQGWGEPGSDEIPVYYQCQVQQYLMVTGFILADVVVSFAGAMPEIYEVPADKELQDMILEQQLDFWKLVESRTPPEPISFADMMSMYGRVSKSASVMATPEIIGSWSKLKEIRTRMKDLEKEEEALKATLMGTMGENDTLVDPDGKALVTWKLSKPTNRFDAKALEAAEPDIYSRYIKIGEPSRRFLVK